MAALLLMFASAVNSSGRSDCSEGKITGLAGQQSRSGGGEKGSVFKSEPPSDKHRESANAYKGDADMPKRNQNELELAWVTQIVASAQAHEMHRHVGCNQKKTASEKDAP